jgi:hypothetical protein
LLLHFTKVEVEALDFTGTDPNGKNKFALFPFSSSFRP